MSWRHDALIPVDVLGSMKQSQLCKLWCNVMLDNNLCYRLINGETRANLRIHHCFANGIMLTATTRHSLTLPSSGTSSPSSSSLSSPVSYPSASTPSGLLPLITTMPRRLLHTNDKRRCVSQTNHFKVSDKLFSTYSWGEGSRPKREFSVGTYKHPPKTSTKCLAMTSWYWTLQWFSNDKITGNESG